MELSERGCGQNYTKLALSNSYWRNDCNLIVLFLINSNDALPYIIRFVNFVVLTFDSTIPLDSSCDKLLITAS